MTRPLKHLGVVFLAALVAGGFGIANLGCSPYKYEDDDEICSKAKPLPPTVVVKDELDFGVGDKSDCKTIRYFKDAIAQIEYRLGTAFEKHNIKGTLTLYNQDGQVIEQKIVDPSIFKYDFEFPIEGNKPHYVEFVATEGKYAYSAQVQYAQPPDPCDKCTAEQDCIEGRCVDKPKVCEPECDEEAGELCQEGVCVYQCDERCKRKSSRYWACNVETGDCERNIKRCRPACGRGYRCNYRNGQCYKVRAPKTCAGGCKPGEVCKDGECVSLGGKKCPPCPAGQVCSSATGYQCVAEGEGPGPVGDIRGVLTSTVRAPNGTIVYINRGKRHGVKRGANGRLCKHKFVVTNVYATRSKARTNATIEEIGGCKSVVIPR